MKLLVECEFCKSNFSVDKESITSDEFTIDNEKVWLTYYECPVCGSQHFVQIDDTNSKELLSVCSNKLAMLATCKVQGIKVTRRQSENFKQSRMDLDKTRIELMKKFTGKKINNKVTGNVINLRFSV